MPRKYSRLTLEIVNVRCERLQDISEQDAKAEGVERAKEDHIPLYSFRMGYELQWDAVNGKKHPWESNPWVWVIKFKKVETALDKNGGNG